MRQELATGLVVGTGSYVGPIPTTGLNGVKADLLVLSSSGAMTVSCDVEQSNDAQNWESAGVTAATTTIPGYTTAKTTGATSQATAAYVRLKLYTSTGTACVTAGIDFFKYST